MENPSTSALPSSTSTAATFGKRWRDKLRNKDKKSNSKLTVDEVVNDFLGAHRKNQSSVSSGTDVVGSPQGDPPAYVLPKQPRRPGLKVTFNLGPPTVIGEGGEEADLPTRHIGLSRAPKIQAQEPEPEEASDIESAAEEDGLPSIAVNGSGNDELGFDDNWRPPLTTDTTLLRALSSAGTGGRRRSRLSMRLDDETAELARKVRAKMMEEEGRALHQKPPEEDEEAKEAAREARRSIEMIEAERENNIHAPQPQRIVAYRPPGDYDSADEFEDERPPENLDAPRSEATSGIHVQDMISHLRDQDDSMLDSSGLETTNEDAPEYDAGTNTIMAYNPANGNKESQRNTSARQLPALNPFDTSLPAFPRTREHDSPVSPIRTNDNGSVIGSPPTSRDMARSPPSFNNLMRSPPQTQSIEQLRQRSPSPEPPRERLSPQAKRTPSKWTSILSRHNTTARPRQQPSSENLMSRSNTTARPHLQPSSESLMSRSNTTARPHLQPSSESLMSRSNTTARPRLQASSETLMSRSNTTARPRQQPSSESLMSRSLSMRAGSKSRRPSDQPPSSSGWHKFQYQPMPSLSTNLANAKDSNAQSLSPVKEQGRVAAYSDRSPLPSPSPVVTPTDLQLPPTSSNPSSASLPPNQSKESLGQSSAAKSSLTSLDSPTSSSATTLPTYNSATALPLLQEDASPQKEAPTAKKSWRTLTAAVTRDALSDFSAAAEKYYDTFSARAEDLPSISSLEDKKLLDWVRASVWWILKGRSQLEAAIRYGATGVELQQQGAVSLAKAWWINAEVVPNHAEFARLKHQVATANGSSNGSETNLGTDLVLNLVKGLGDARLSSLIALHQGVSSHVRALATSMKRNNISLPPPDRLPRDIDLSVWENCPYLGADVSALLSTLVPKSLRVDQRTKMSDIDVGELMPFNDTSRFFSYGRMFVKAVLHSDDDDDDYGDEGNQEVPCVLSLTRDRSDWHVQAFIASQSNLVNVVIQSDKRQGPTWHDVRFDPRRCVALIRLSRGWKLEIKFEGADAKMDFERLWKMVEYTRKVEAGLDCEENETIAFESVLKAFQYVGAPGAAGTPFPSEPTQRCRIRLFEKQVPMNENGGTRFAHMGFRMICVTSPKIKNLSSLSHTFTHSAPIIFAHARSKDEDDSPILLLRLTNRQTGASYQVRLTFYEPAEMIKVHSILLNFNLQQEEEKTPDIPMRSYSIEEPAMATRSNATFLPCLLAFPGQAATKPGVTVNVINTARDLLEHGQSPAIMSNSLRLFIKCGWGSVTDRMNLAPGELKISLDPQSLTTFSIYRRGQHDLLVSMAENLAPQEARDTITKFLKAAGSTPTIRKFQFSSARDLHRFQHALTGFDVLFDGFATSFAISRRRMVVPIYKKWEASGVRLQILQQEKSVQLVAFFADFSHGKGMNFAVKGTDVFEIFTKGGKYGVRIVDAKFPLPKRAGQPSGEEGASNVGEEHFLSLDLPEFPSEHDDITILFEDERSWKEFQTAVPGIIREQSKIGSLRH